MITALYNNYIERQIYNEKGLADPTNKYYTNNLVQTDDKIETEKCALTTLEKKAKREALVAFKNKKAEDKAYRKEHNIKRRNTNTLQQIPDHSKEKMLELKSLNQSYRKISEETGYSIYKVKQYLVPIVEEAVVEKSLSLLDATRNKTTYTITHGNMVA